MLVSAACGGSEPNTPPPACVVQAVSVAPAAASLQAGRTLDLTVGITQQNCGTLPVTWSTGAPNIAAVGPTGQVTGLAPGSATITAAAGGRSGDAVVTVVAGPPFTVVVTPAATTLEALSSVQMAAVVRDSLGNAVAGTPTWTSSETTVATVNASGLVTGVRAGTATITASAGGRVGTAVVTVTPPGVASIVVVPGNRTVDAGTTLMLQGQALDRNGGAVSQPLTWTVSNPATASVVTTTGNVASVELLTSGPVTVTASAGGRSGAVLLTSVPRRPRFAYAYVGDTLAQAPAVAFDTTDVSYSSAGGQVTVQRVTPGKWRVLFHGLRLAVASEPMLPVIRPMGSAAGGCVVTSRYSGPFNPSVGDVYGLEVACLAPDGSPQVRPFLVAVFGSNYTTTPWAFAEVVDSTAGTTGNAYIPGGGVATATRLASDTYRLQLGPLPTGFDVWHPVSMSPGLQCGMTALAGSGATRGLELDCITALAARTRSRTGALVILGGRDGSVRADAMIAADGGVATTGGAIGPVLNKPATGIYSVRVTPPGFASSRYPAFLVTATRSASNPTVACRVVALTTPVPGTAQARVECRDAIGVLRDNGFAFSAVY
ncbi:MAG: Ig-like domain-containing protein [Gemmatimonadetes bacterium]|nr:Ig-like domain-containing protein [Gemmatimonadota bacterium]